MKKHLLKLLLLCCIGILALSMFACVPSTDQYKLDFIVEGEVYYSRITNGYSRINPPKDPTREGYSFEGWYFDEEYTREYHSYSLEKDPIKADTKVYAKWEVDDSHTCVAGQWEVSVAATCKSEGQEVKRCTVDYCGEILETRVIPISGVHPSTYEVEKNRVAATCSTEGSYTVAKYCTVCNKQVGEDKTVTLEIDKDAHDYINRVLTKVGDSFEFDANCANCDKTIALNNVVVETVVVKEATCADTGLVNYVYSGFGGAVIENVVTSAKGHVVAGVEITNRLYSEVYDKEILDKVELFEDAMDKACGEEVPGLFLCETCNTYCNIRVAKPHEGVWQELKAPTCHSRGKEVLPVCTACKKTTLDRYPAATGNHVAEGLALRMDKASGTFDLVVPCINAGDGCTYAEVRLSDVPVTSEEIIGKDCYSPDVIRYTYTGGGEHVVYDDAVRSGHFLNGVRASTLADPDEGWFDYRLVTPKNEPGGIKLFADRVLECEDEHIGYYDCTSCRERVDVVIYRPHSGSWITTKAPTCSEEGISNFYCDFCDYGDDNSVTALLPVVPHNYTWKLVIDKSSGEPISPFNLVGTCTCQVTKTIKNVLVTAKVSKEPTCSAVGELIYACEYQGREYYVTEDIPKVDHSIDGNIVNTKAGGRFDYAEYVLTGKITLKAAQVVVCESNTPVIGYFSCSECNETVLVNVYRTHSGEIVETLDPSSTACIQTGTRHLDCIYDNCEGTTPVKFTEYHHDYAVNVINAGSTYTVVVSCNAEDCELHATPAEYKNIAAVDINIITPASCLSSGAVEYSFRYDGEVLTFPAIIEQGNHVFHGVDYTTLLDSNGLMSDDLAGIILTDDNTHAFKCEVCDHFVRVDVKSADEE